MSMRHFLLTVLLSQLFTLTPQTCIAAEKQAPIKDDPTTETSEALEPVKIWINKQHAPFILKNKDRFVLTDDQVKLFEQEIDRMKKVAPGRKNRRLRRFKLTSDDPKQIEELRTYLNIMPDRRLALQRTQAQNLIKNKKVYGLTKQQVNQMTKQLAKKTKKIITFRLKPKGKKSKQHSAKILEFLQKELEVVKKTNKTKQIQRMEENVKRTQELTAWRLERIKRLTNRLKELQLKEKGIKGTPKKEPTKPEAKKVVKKPAEKEVPAKKKEEKPAVEKAVKKEVVKKVEKKEPKKIEKKGVQKPSKKKIPGKEKQAVKKKVTKKNIQKITGKKQVVKKKPVSKPAKKIIKGKKTITTKRFKKEKAPKKAKATKKTKAGKEKQAEESKTEPENQAPDEETEGTEPAEKTS
ncbi:MAG: hypothetical protein V1855_04725 [bacterium]